MPSQWTFHQATRIHARGYRSQWIKLGKGERVKDPTGLSGMGGQNKGSQESR